MLARKRVLQIAAVFAAAAVRAQAVTVTLPDTSLTTYVNLSGSTDVATVTVPATLTFAVHQVGSASSATAALSVTAISIAGTNQLKISLNAAAAAFTPPSAGATTWNAADVSWAAGSWSHGTGSPGTLSSSAYTTVATCSVNALFCNNNAIAFTLAAKPGVKISGNHTLTMTWKFESIGP